MPANDPIHMRPAPGYLEGRSRRITVIMIAVIAAIGGGHLIEDLHKGTPLPTALGLFALTTALVAGIVILVSKYLLTKWQLVLKPDGAIEILGPGAKKIRVSGGDAIVCERSPDGGQWLLQSQQTGKLLQKLPYAAFPKLQETWNKMRR
jgi:hypothetical protein